eukprot:g8759.t1
MLRPKPQQWTRNFQRMERVKNQYCLNKTPLSFYDTFWCVTGVPAFLLNESDLEIDSEEKHSSLDVGSSSSRGKRQGNEKSRSKSHQGLGATTTTSVRECTFSLDSSRLAVCYSNGEVIIWDTDHGTLVKKITIGENEISAVSFHGGSNSVLLICTANHKCWRCNTSGDDAECTEFLGTKEVSGISGEIYLQRSDFFMNGNMLVLSFIANCEHGLELRIVLVDTSLDPNKSQHLKLSPVPLEQTFVISKVALSPDGRGILIGLIDEGMEDSFCVLWPNFTEKYFLYHKLRIGTVGGWSLDSKYVVTWTMIGTSNLEDDNRSSAFIWNVEEIREQPRNHEYSLEPNHTTITNSYKDQVFWCHIVTDMDKKHRLIMGIAGESIRFLYWDLESKTHTHTIETKISARDMILCNREAWIKAYIEQMSVKGLSPVAVREDGIFFGAILGWPSDVFMWDVHFGIEVLKISPRDLKDNQFKGGIDLIGSPSCEKFAIVGNNGVMVFCVAVPSKYTNKKEELLETQMVKLENQNMSYKITDYKMKFSGDGDTLGVLCIGLPKMQLWNLPQGTTCLIDVTQLHGGSIRDFSISYNGKYLTTYTDKYIYVWRCDPDNIQPIGLIEIDSEVVDMGIKDDALEIVLCLSDGSILVYYKQTTDEISNFDSENGTSISNPSIEDDSGQCFRTLRSDLEQPLLSDSVLPHETPLESVEIDSLNKKYPLSKRLVLCEGAGNEEAKFQVSSDFRRVIRILDLKNVETWNLETKEKIEDKVMDVERIARSSESYSRVSSVSKYISRRLQKEVESSLKDTSITLTKQTTIVQALKEHIVVAAKASSSGLVQTTNQTTYDIKYEEKECDSHHSVYVVNLNNVKYRRRLNGKDLDPGKGLAISDDGRHIACFAGDFASKVIVWNAYASERLLPDYHFLALNGVIENKEVIKKEIVPMIDLFGVNFFNFQHHNGITILNEALWYFNNDLSRTILQYALKKSIKVSFLISKTSISWRPISAFRNMIDTSIAGRSPHTLKVMLKYLLERVTHEVEIVTILGDSLIHILQECPRIFVGIIKDFRMLGLFHDIEVQETCMEKRKFIVQTSKCLNLSSNDAEKCWQEELNSHKENIQPNGPLITTKATSLPYEGACNIGKTGLLHNMLTYRTHHSAFDSFVVQAIVDYKWEKYAKETLIHEFLYHCLVSFSFTIYCFFLCNERTYKMKPDDIKAAEYEENSNPTTVSLIICTMLAFPCLVRELRQCGVYIVEQGIFGFFYWLTSAWNWMEVLGYINLVIIIPLGEFWFLNKGEEIPFLSALIAVESLIIWSRMLFYARPFKRTGPLVVTVSAIAYEIGYFLMLTLTVMVGFALAFKVLYRHAGSTEEQYDDVVRDINIGHVYHGDDKLDSMHKAFGTFRRSCFTVFGYTFGNFDMDILYNAPKPFITLFLFLLYVMIIAIILLNMLIALMSEKFSRMHKDRNVRYTEARARAIDDIDNILSRKRREQLRKEIQKYLQIALPINHYERMTKRSNLSETSSNQKKKINEVIKSEFRRELSRSQSMQQHTFPQPLGRSPVTMASFNYSGRKMDTIPEPDEQHQASIEYSAQPECWYDSDNTSSDIELQNSDEDDD